MDWSKFIFLSLWGFLLLFASPAPAADRVAARGETRYSDRDKRDAWNQGKQELAQALKAGEERDFYRQQLEKQGFQITAINYDTPDYVEYEVVKGDQTYEVQIDLDKNSRKAKKVEIDTNVWKAETTEQILEGKKVDKNRMASAKGDRRFSDRDRRANSDSGKAELERVLKSGEDKDFYRRELEKLGYKVTSVNYDKPDYVEFEVVKADQTYEVQIDLDKNSHKANKVEVASNMWKADATKRALQGKGSSPRAAAPRDDRTTQNMGGERTGMRTSGNVANTQARGDTNARVSVRTGSQEIKQAQQALKDKGHDPGRIDGVMGSRTQQALKEFQQANGIQATGSLNSETKAKLGLDSSTAERGGKGAETQTWENTQVEGNRESGGGAGASKEARP